MTKQYGSTMVIAMFILVVLGLLGGYMVKIHGVQTHTSLMALQSARAYQAARAGVQWAVANINAGGNCASLTSASPMTFSGLTGFSVALSCNQQTYSEGTTNPVIYQVTVNSQYGVYNQPHYVSRILQVSVVN